MKDNPFSNNYVFKYCNDANRKKIKWWRYPSLWFRSTYVQLSGAWAFYYKMSGGKIYLLSVEPLTPIQKEVIK